MTEIYLIRHTQAVGNVYRMMQGHWDGDITDLGKEEIDALAERFKDVHLDRVYSSDLQRAVKTAKGVTRYNGLEITQVREIREINMGPWETKFFGNLKYEKPEMIRAFMSDSENWYLEGAETFEQVKQRAYAALEKIAKENDGKTIAVVSHGITIRCMLSIINGVPLSDTKKCPICKNTAVNKLIYENGKFKCEYYNDYSHLGDMGNYHWWKTSDLRDVVIDVDEESDYYTKCYLDTWEFAHPGKSDQCDTEYYRTKAKEHEVYKIYDEDKEAGLLDLDMKSGENDDYGWISLLYLNEDYRDKGCGIQVLARAITRCINENRKKLKLTVAKSNERAVRFYEKNGFKKVAIEMRRDGPLYTMEKEL